MRTAVVEVGTASLRALVVEPTTQGWYRVHAEHRVVLGLHRAVRRQGKVGEGLLELVDVTVRRLADAGVRAGARRTVARIAAGLRDAADIAELRRRTATALGAPVEVSDLEGEARALTDAVLARTDPPSPSVLVDLGDHELRAILLPAGTRGVVSDVVSLAAGTRDLLPEGAVDPYHPAVRGHLRSRLDSLLDGLAPLPPSVAWPVVMGPVADALARSVVARRWGLDGLDHDGCRVSRASLAAFEHEMARSSATQRLLLPSVDPADVDLAGVGSLLLDALCERLGAPGVVVSRARVHEGSVLAALGLSVPASQGVRAAAIGARTGSAHAELTGRFAASLFDQLGPLHGGDARDRRLLLDAACLHDLGDAAGPEAPHRRGAAMLLASGVRGCGPEDLVELAALVRFQRGRPPGAHFGPYGRLPARRRETVRRLTALLRMACALDTSGDGSVTAVTATHEQERLTLCLEGRGDLQPTLRALDDQLRTVAPLLAVEPAVRAEAARERPRRAVLDPVV